MMRVGSLVVRTMEPIVVVVTPSMDVQPAVSALAAEQDTCIGEGAPILHGLQKIAPSTAKTVQLSVHQTDSSRSFQVFNLLQPRHFR